MKLLFTIAIWCISVVSLAQPSLLNMTEIPLENTLSYYQFFHKKGNSYSLLVREIHEIGENPVLRYYQLNKALEIVQQSFYPLSENTEIAFADENRDNIFILLKKNGLTYELLVLDKLTSDFESPQIIMPANTQISHLLATEDALFIGGKTRDKTTAYKLPFNANKFQILFHHLNRQTNIKALQYHNDAKVVSFLMEVSHGNDIEAYLINQYQKNGDLLYNVSVPTPNSYRMVETKLKVLDAKNSILVGTYSQNIASQENVMGLFSINIKEKNIIDTKFYNLGRVDNFFTYLPEKQAGKNKRRIDKASAKMQPIKTRLTLLLDNLQVIDNNVLLSGNSFTKIKKADRSHSFKYLNTFLTCFDQKGRLLWNNTLTYPNEELTSSSPFLLTEASVISGTPFFIQKQQYIYRSKETQTKTYHNNITETYIHDGFLDINYKNLFYEQNMELSPNGDIFYFGVREKTPTSNLMNSKMYFFVEHLKALPESFISKGEN